MQIIGLGQDDINAVLRIVAAVLHLGNIGFEASSRDDAVIAGKEEQVALEAAAELLGSSPQALLGALTVSADILTW
jgi:myosin-5